MEHETLRWVEAKRHLQNNVKKSFENQRKKKATFNVLLCSLALVQSMHWSDEQAPITMILIQSLLYIKIDVVFNRIKISDQNL